MVLKELLLVLESCSDRLVGVDVALTAVHDRNIAQTKWDNATRQDIHDIRPSIP